MLVRRKEQLYPVPVLGCPVRKIWRKSSTHSASSF